MEGIRLTLNSLFTKEVLYILLIFALFVLPKLIQRLRIPTAVTSMILGAAAAYWFPQLINDSTINLLSTLGIVGLFLFAGLELKLADIKSGGWMLVQHIMIGLLYIFLASLLISFLLKMSFAIGVLISLALFTPSTGFILDSLRTLGVSEVERFWIKSIAIAAELVALLALFIIVQSASLFRFSTSLLILISLIILLPLLFRFFAEKIVPHAPNSEFAFLLIVALASALITYRLGVYYLVGAFIVGITAQRFRQNLPALTSENMLHAIEVFAAFFIPFYFFNAGLHLNIRELDWNTAIIAVGLIVLIIPFRVILIGLHRKIIMKESFRDAIRIGIAISPTLVFSLVLAEILKESFQAPLYVYGSIWIYALANTMIPGFTLKIPPPDFESLHLSDDKQKTE